MQSFLKKILPSVGYPIAVTIESGLDYPNTRIYDCIDDLEKALPHLDSISTAVYFGLGTAKEFKKFKARKTENILGYKSLWMDIDVKDTQYSDIKDAYLAFLSFLKAVGLPKAMVVKSGNGLHIYWPLNELMTVDQWRPVPGKIIACAKHAGLMFDVNCVKLPTQILRPVGTTHRKDPDNPIDVKLVVDLDIEYDLAHFISQLDHYILEHDLVVNEIKKYNAENTQFHQLAAALGGEYIPKIEYRDSKPILKECQQFREGATCSEPVWRGVISTALLCENGEELAHELSSEDGRYDADDTDQKIENIKISQNGSPMPYTCASFDDLNPGVCNECKHFGKITSPIVLGIKKETQEIVEEAKVIPETKKPEKASGLPKIVTPSVSSESKSYTIQTEAEAYFLREDGLYVHLPKSSDSDKKRLLICSQKCYPIKKVFQISQHGNKEYYYVWRIEESSEVFNDAVISADVFHKDEQLVKAFTKIGVILEDKAAMNLFSNYSRKAINIFSEQHEATEIYTHLGWQHDGVFVSGLNAIDRDGSQFRAYLNEESSAHANNSRMKTSGELKEWIKAAEVLNNNQQYYGQLAVMSAFAAPLMKMVSTHGLILSLHGVTGVGKTAIQKIASSVWGDPEPQMIPAPGTQLGSTEMSVIRKIGMYKNLPVMLDELSNMDKEKVSNFIHALSAGVEKSRLKSGKNSEYTSSVGVTWDTFFVTSSNDSLRDKLSNAKLDSVAESMRIFEILNIPLPKLSEQQLAIGDTHIKALDSNYGWAGLIYSQWLQANQHNLRDWLKLESSWLKDKVNGKQDERFWIQGMAAILVGMQISHAAGLHTYDLDELRSYIVEQYYAQRECVVQVKEYADTAFSEMINHSLGECVIVNTGNTMEKGIIQPILTPRTGRLSMRIEINKGIGYISTTRVKDWCNFRDIPKSMLIKNGVDSGYLSENKPQTRIVLGKNVEGLSGGGRVRCYAFKLAVGDLELIKEKIEKENKDGET